MQLSLRTKTLRVMVALFTMVAITIVSCTPLGGNQPPPSADGPQFVINSPLEGASVAGPIFFSVQPLNASEVASVTLEAGGKLLAADFPGEDTFKVFLIPSEFADGPLELKATVTGKDGKTSSKSTSIKVIANPPSSTTVNADGAVLGTKEANGATSILTIPPGTGQGANVSFEARTKEQIKATTGVDYDALGVTFLGAQEINSSQAITAPLGISSGGFAPMVQPGQAVVNYMIAPDADGDGKGELVVVNTASVAPNGDVISDPVPQIVLGGNATVSSVRGSSLRSLANGLNGPPGTLIEIGATGFNPYSLIGNQAVFRSSVDGTEVKQPGLVDVNIEDASKQVFRTFIPFLPAGEATLTLHNKSTGYTSPPITVNVLASAPLQQPAITIINTFLDRSIDLMGNGLVTDPKIKEYSDKTISELMKIKSNLNELSKESHPEVQEFLTNLASFIESANIFQATALTAQQEDCYDHIIVREQENVAFWLLGVGGFALGVAGGWSLIPGLMAAAAPVAAVGTGLLLAGGLVYAMQWTMKTFFEPCFTKRPPIPTPTPSQAPAPNPRPNLGMGSAPPPGAPGAGPVLMPPPPANQNASSLRAAQVFEQTPGRVHVKVLSSGSSVPFTGITDAGGYFFIPMIPNGQPFTAIATDTLTGESRTFEGVGKPVGESVFIFFDFLSDDAGEIPRLEHNTNTAGVLDRQALYSFNGEAGKVVNLTALIDNPSNLQTNFPSIHVIDPAGNVILPGCCSAGPGPGIYWIMMAPFELPLSGIYLVEISSRITEALPYTLGFADIEAPIPITLANPSLTITANVSILGDYHYYRFSGTQGEEHKIRLDVSEGDLTARLLIRKDDGGNFFNRFGANLLGTGVSLAPSVRIGETRQFALPETGDYIIEIDSTHLVRFGKASFLGPYEMTVFSFQ